MREAAHLVALNALVAHGALVELGRALFHTGLAEAMATPQNHLCSFVCAEIVVANYAVVLLALLLFEIRLQAKAREQGLCALGLG